MNGQLLQTNKTFDMLKQRQKEKISEWMYAAYKRCMNDGKTKPAQTDDMRIIEEVLGQIKEAGIWIPDGEIYAYYERKNKRLLLRFEKELERNGANK